MIVTVSLTLQSHKCITKAVRIHSPAEMNGCWVSWDVASPSDCLTRPSCKRKHRGWAAFLSSVPSDRNGRGMIFKVWEFPPVFSLGGYKSTLTVQTDVKLCWNMARDGYLFNPVMPSWFFSSKMVVNRKTRSKNILIWFQGSLNRLCDVFPRNKIFPLAKSHPWLRRNFLICPPYSQSFCGLVPISQTCLPPHRCVSQGRRASPSSAQRRFRASACRCSRWWILRRRRM